ncbi:hypothetical protein [Candidatus Regiella insecticola]|uniref:hypothetical protein n=1 Tax=Candidatus Regiella insecticola TaxID=138073 RepID=UPI001596D5AF|nr:hypothetical protein [Candidatus Regiella insecticola]
MSGEAPIAQEKIEEATPNSNIEKAGKEQLPSQVADQVETEEVITNNMPSRQASKLALNITDKIDGCRGEIVSKEYLEALNTEKQQYLEEWIQNVKIRIQDVKIKTQQLPLKGDIKIKEIINEFQKEIDELSEIRNTLDCSDKNKDAILKLIVILKETIKELKLNVVEKVASEQSSIVEEPNQYKNYMKTLLEQNKGINRIEVLQEDINRLTYEIRPEFLHGSPERETVSTLIEFLEEAMVSEQPSPA